MPKEDAGCGREPTHVAVHREQHIRLGSLQRPIHLQCLQCKLRLTSYVAASFSNRMGSLQGLWSEIIYFQLHTPHLSRWIESQLGQG